MLGRAAILHQRERQVGWWITSPHPGPCHPRTGPPLRRSPVGCRKPECPQVSTVIKTEPARRRHGGGETSNKAPLLPGVMWTASVAPVATCAQLPETIPSLVYAAATTTLSLSRPQMCPRPFLVHPTDPQGLAGAASHPTARVAARAVRCGSQDRVCTLRC